MPNRQLFSNSSHFRLVALIAVMGVTGLVGLKLLFNSNAATTVTGTSQTDLVNLVQNVPDAASYHYGTKDSQGYSLDTAKIIANPAGGYLAVYHANNVVRVASSTDLKNWTFKYNLAAPAINPTIATAGGGFLVVDEYTSKKVDYLHFMYYSNLANLYAGKLDRQFVTQHTLTTCNEGTPSISSVKLSPDITHSVIDIGFHYQNACGTDREATGRLTNFSSWTTSVATSVNNALITAAAKTGKTINGDIGDRDTMTYGSTMYGIFEVQYTRNDASSTRPYLYNYTTNQAQALTVKTHKGSQAFTHPTFTALKGPDGTNGVVVTMSIPNEGSAIGEAGELVYYVRTSNPPATPAPVPAPIPAPPAAHPSTTSTTPTSTTKSSTTTTSSAATSTVNPTPTATTATNTDSTKTTDDSSQLDANAIAQRDAQALAASADKQAPVKRTARTWISLLVGAALLAIIAATIAIKRRRTALATSTAPVPVSDDPLTIDNTAEFSEGEIGIDKEAEATEQPTANEEPEEPKPAEPETEASEKPDQPQ